MAEEGIVLDIDSKFLDRLKQADTSLEKLVKATDKLTKSFSDMADTGLKNFANAMDSIISKVAELSGAKIGDMGIKETAKTVSTAADNINEALDTIREVKEEASNPVPAPSNKGYEFVNIPKLEKEIAEAKEKLEKLKLKRSDANKKLKVLELGDATPSQLRDAENKAKIAKKEVSTQNNFIKKLEKQLIEAKANIQSLTNELMSGAISGFMPIGEMKARVKEINDILHSIPSAYPDPQKQQEVVDKLVALRERYKQAMKSSSQKAEEYQKQIDAEKKVDENIQKAIDAEDKANKKKAQSVIDNYNKETEAARKSYEARRQMYEKLWAEKDEAELNTMSGAMGYSSSAQSINERVEAIRHLKIARDALKESDFASGPEYKKALAEINEEIRRQEQRVNRLTHQYSGLNSVIDRIKPLMMGVFGIQAIRSYVHELTNIRGEFELQQRSLHILLKSRTEADKLWKQTTDLALRSPFQVKELVTATKQLAAYRVESDKLHDTTRMLADISAGLGVEMSRLILAFGQVKAANFLRGTELRQFSEAGINMLDELAEYYTNIEGKTVTVAEVFNRISKRQVLFADVEAVLQRVTSEGGTFFKMQEEQADTLKGKISNLKDSYQLMLNDIGKANDGNLKGAVELIKILVDNWEVLSAILKTGVALWGANAIAMSKFGKIVRRSSGPMAGLGRGIGLIGTGIKTATMSIKSFFAAMGPVGWAIMALEAMYAILKKISGGFGKDIKNVLNDIAKSTDKINRISIKFNVAKEDGNLARQKEELEAYLEALSNELSLEITPSTNLNDDSLTAEQIQAEMDNAQRLANMVSTAMTNFGVAKAKQLRGTWLTNALGADAEDFGVTAAKTLYELTNARTKILSELGRTSRVLSEREKVVYESLIKAEQVAGETSDEYLHRLTEIFRTIKLGEKETSGNIFTIISSAKSAVSGYSSDLHEFTYELADILRQLNLESMSEEDRKLVLEAVIETESAKAQWTSMTEWMALEWAKQRYYPNIVSPQESQTPYDNDPLRGQWQERYNRILMEETNDGFIQLHGVSKAVVDTEIDNVKKALEAAVTYYKQIVESYESGGAAYLKSEYDDAVKELEKTENVGNRFFGKDWLKKATGNGTDNRYTDLIKTVNDVYSAFDKLEEKFDKVTATEMLWRDYSDAIDTAFKKIGKSADWVREQFGDLTDKKSLKSALDWIAQNASTKEARLQAQTASAKISVDLEIEARDKQFDDLTRQMEDLFSGYELSIELDKLHIPKDFAKDFFNLDSIDITELRKRVVDKQSEFKGTEGEKAYKDYLDKLDEMEVKSQQERLKRYLEFSREAIGERAKIMLDGFYELQDIEKAFQLTNTLAFNKGLISDETKTRLEMMGKTISDLFEMDSTELAGWQLTKEDLVTLKEFNEELERQAQIAGEASKKKVSEELNKMDWEAFRGSDTFQTLFNDLEGASEQALDALIKHLEKYKDQWSSLPLGQMKAMVKLLEQAKEAQAGLVGPMEGLRNARAKMAESGYSDRGTAEADLFSSEQRIAELDHELAVLAEVQRLKDEGYTDFEIFDTLSFEDASIAMSQTKDNAETLKGEQEKISSSAKQYLDNLKKIPKYYSEIRERATKVKQAVDKTFDGWDAINELFDDGSMTKELATLVRDASDLGFEAFNSVQMFKEAKDQIDNAAEGAELFGQKMNAALGIIGLIITAVQIIAKVLKFAFEQHDKSLQKQIDAQLLKIEELQDAYEDLEKQIEKAYTAVDLGRLTKEATNNLNAQIKATEEAIALEEDKKKTDEDAIRDWEDDIRDMRKSIEELQEETFSTLTDGILDDVLDTTRGFVDAWHDAYEETGDGMKGFEENFTDMLRNMLRQQASMQLISPFIKKYKNWLSEYVNEDDDPTLTTAEASAWAERVRATFPELNELLKGFFEGTQGLLETGGELSDLEKGIQGMTEDQAEVLAAYWNSCRFILANIDSTLTQMASATLGGAESNPILSELRAQTELIRSISNLFSSVVGYGESNHSGAYLKVLMS